MVDGINFFDQPIKNDFKTYERKIATLEKLQQVKVMITQLDVYYPYFKKSYKLIENRFKQTAKIDADPKAIQKIYFTRI